VTRLGDVRLIFSVSARTSASLFLFPVMKLRCLGTDDVVAIFGDGRLLV
jgi:hypothetical protein